MTFSSLNTSPVTRIWAGVTARIVRSELVTMAIVELAPGGVVPEHQHVNEQLGFVITGSLRFTVDGSTRDRGPGDTWRILADVPHSAMAGPAGAVVAEVYSPVRSDWAELPDLPARTPLWP
jgi:quercetin dioxygenase-like cupin family protein